VPFLAGGIAQADSRTRISRFVPRHEKHRQSTAPLRLISQLLGWVVGGMGPVQRWPFAFLIRAACPVFFWVATKLLR
jgi:hypothetical protein